MIPRRVLYKPPGRMRSVEEFLERWRAIDPELGCDLELEGSRGPLGRPFEHRGRRLANRFAVQPMEGWDGTPDGLPSELTLRRWRRFGRSGAGLVWGGEAFAVREDGRANPRQLFANPRADTLGGLVRLREALEAGFAEQGLDPQDAYVGLQLTHAGRFANRPRVAFRHPVLDPRTGVADDRAVLGDAELEGIAEAFVAAAKLAWAAGFGFVDVKCCHGYLLHELLAARTRPGPYGGSLAGRTRLLRGIVRAIRTECPGLEVAVRLSLADVFPHRPRGEEGVGAAVDVERHVPYRFGFGVDPRDPLRPDPSEGVAVLRRLHDLDVRLVNVTLGSPYWSPHLQRPATYPPGDGYLPPEDPLVGVAWHVRMVRAARRAVPDVVLVGSGYSYLQEFLAHVGQHEVRRGHVDFVGLGRSMLSYPELAFDVLHGRPLDHRRICRTFSDCTTAARHGLPSGCYPLDPEYRRRPRPW